MTWNLGGDLGTGYVSPISPGIGADLVAPAGVVYASGFNSVEFGSVIANSTKLFNIFGIDGSSIGQASIANTRRAFSVAGTASAEYGLSFIADYFQYARQLSSGSDVFGQASVSNLVQYVGHAGSIFTLFGTQSVEREKIANPAGFDSSSVPLPKVADKATRLRTTNDLLFYEAGSTLVYNLRQIAFSQGFIETEFSDYHAIRNKNSVILASHDLLFPEVIYTSFAVIGYASVANFNKEIRPDATFTERMSRGHSLTMGLAPIQLPSVADTLIPWPKVGYAIREFPVAGFMDLKTGYGFCYNKAFGVWPIGIDGSSVSGLRGVEYGPKIAYTFGSSTQEFGQAWVSSGARSIEVEGIFAQRMDDRAWVDRSPREVSPRIVQIHGRVGSPFIRVSPKLFMNPGWSDLGRFGLASARNRNVEVRPFSMRSDILGLPFVYNEVQYFSSPSVSAFVDGEHFVENANRTYFVQSIVGGIGLGVVEIEMMPFDQELEPEGSDLMMLGTPLAYDGIIRPDGVSSFFAGEAFCREMAILPKSILSEEIGIPFHPGPQPVFVGPTDELPNLTSYGIESGIVGFPRMSPYRIYATPDSPPLYAQNNPPGIYFPVDFGANKIGNAFADNAVRSFQVPAADTSNGQVIERFGTPIVTDNRAVFVYPDRVRGRVGFAVLGGIDTKIKALWQTETSFGETSVVDLGPRTVRPGQSPITEEIGQAWASRDPEEILVPAMDFLQMPGLTQVNRPFLPFLVLGGVYDLHGNAFVSNSPQYIEGITAGFQQLILTDDINKRLRVIRRDRLPMSSGDVSQFGQSFVSFGVREIWASAPMRHRPAGPMVAIRATATAEDSSEVGAISFG